MLLNLFFNNINGQLELVLIGIFIFALYWFIMRKYNSLGLRLFILCFLVFAAVSFWIYQDEAALKNTLQTGEEHIATMISKEQVGKDDNEVQVSFTAKNGKIINTKTSTYVSKDEWDNFETGKPLSVIYVEASNQVFVQQSIMRFKGDKIYLYYFAVFFLVLGIVLLVWLRKLKVKVDETGNEWVEKEDGTVLLDERRSKSSQVLKKVNIISKMVQVFGK